MPIRSISITSADSRCYSVSCPELVYSTPHSAMWTAYCECFKHTLIVSNPQFGATSKQINDIKKFPPGRALVVYSFNRKTKDITGRFINKWNYNSQHIIERQTLSAKLPIEIIEVCSFAKVTSKDHGSDVKVHVTRNKYIKSEDVPLYLTQDHTPFNRKCYSQEENLQSLTQAGLIPHPNCTVSLPLNQWSKFSKATAQIKLVRPEEDIQHNAISKKVTPKDNLKPLKLSDLSVGIYDIKEITPRKSTFGRFFINIDYECQSTTITSNRSLDACIPTGGIKASITNSPVAQLKIIQKKRDHNRNIVVNVELIMDNN